VERDSGFVPTVPLPAAARSVGGGGGGSAGAARSALLLSQSPPASPPPSYLGVTSEYISSDGGDGESFEDKFERSDAAARLHRNERRARYTEALAERERDANPALSSIETIKYHPGFLGTRIGAVSSLHWHPHSYTLASGCLDKYISLFAKAE
jgi:hypothetical protein